MLWNTKNLISIREVSEIRNPIFFTRDYYELKYIECPQCGKEIQVGFAYKGHH